MMTPLAMIILSALRFYFFHTSYLSRTPRIYSCKFFLAGVNFFRFNAKIWQLTVYFAVITQKNWQFTVYFVVIYAFFGVNFTLQKFCSCKKNDKYQVCSNPFHLLSE